MISICAPYLSWCVYLPWSLKNCPACQSVSHCLKSGLSAQMGTAATVRPLSRNLQEKNGLPSRVLPLFFSASRAKKRAVWFGSSSERRTSGVVVGLDMGGS